MSAAQAQTDVGISVAGIVSVQPINDSWVGSPYLDEGIGGIRPGIAAGVDVVFDNNLVLIGELSTTTAFEQFQRGRLVWLNVDNFHSGAATTRLRDTLISGLAGYSRSTGSRRVVFAGGVSAVLTTLTQDGRSVEDFFLATTDDTRRPFALTGGVDVLQRLSPRAALTFGARYTWLFRSQNGDQTGAGEQILRISAGVRIGLGR